jgi:hypothetical protein
MELNIDVQLSIDRVEPKLEIQPLQKKEVKLKFCKVFLWALLLTFFCKSNHVATKEILAYWVLEKPQHDHYNPNSPPIGRKDLYKPSKLHNCIL